MATVTSLNWFLASNNIQYAFCFFTLQIQYGCRYVMWLLCYIKWLSCMCHGSRVYPDSLLIGFNYISYLLSQINCSD